VRFGLRIWLRLAAIGLATVLVQIGAVSQVSLFGVSADLVPLVVMSVGLLCGSTAGATMGFAVGLFVDVALLQTLGLSSLLLLAVGYGAGRLRELRDPSNTLTPIAAGAAATAVAGIGFSVLQFLLGVDAQVSPWLVGDVVAATALNAALALPVYVLVRWLLGDLLPGDPRRRRRRAYMTGGLSPISRG
jgi:rod shape-determining protein MreD